MLSDDPRPRSSTRTKTKSEAFIPTWRLGRKPDFRGAKDGRWSWLINICLYLHICYWWDSCVFTWFLSIYIYYIILYYIILCYIIFLFIFIFIFVCHSISLIMLLFSVSYFGQHDLTHPSNMETRIINHLNHELRTPDPLGDVMLGWLDLLFGDPRPKLDVCSTQPNLRFFQISWDMILLGTN